ncbi:hydantoinase/oxoprolinase family protein [Actinomadura madurae]|uniref:hydantoinase/oxoprolinase family protein n=3 Tax=Actinomadura madurae TaxID=1993 RepID=UPI002026B5AD|nr:hydantoinase/oxoprolinase family protein [Actinomadura madurae]MCP9972339.1 hydantoinase/oxoprolinase family protein [Actinomadura madurae]MCQ0003603.1 hydantoinase/oxoprolinase family protein [Actinomadura madurae]URN01054.1 hydantoinase/oxoprolinase family protein [Actinomadura madurae]URN03195.1 hydantoinase/oxoprolinase family protein [Actinomadura madurae]
MALHVGIDVGGTFTDAVAIVDGRVIRGKAFSTKDVTTGILGALDVLRDRVGMAEAEFFAAVDRFVLGNTIVTNAVDEQKYAAVGLLTTQGFRDTLRIARSARTDERDPHKMSAPPDIVERRRIVEVAERVDAHGEVLVPLTEDAIAAAVDAVLAAGAEAIAVCLLWSFRNAVHEQAIGDYLDARHPDVPYTLSSRLTPVYREYERMVTTALDAAVKPIVASHFEHLAEDLRSRGLRARVQIMQVHGGFLSVEETGKAPISMFNSGPVGGVTGARLLGKRLGRRRVLTADMGGTSLDAAAILDEEFRLLPRAEIGGLPTSLTAVDIETIGAGGGSLAWVDGRNLLRVGPQSAGSTPGPACYGKGGTRPAVTDAALVLGLINPDYYLGGTVPLYEEKARTALRKHVAEPLGISEDAAAEGVYRLATSQMSNALRKITVNRGHDPREFTLVGFGGACGLFAAAIAAEAGVREVVIPRNAAVFSAYGLMHADSVFSAVQTSPWTMDQPAAALEKEFAALEERARAWFETEGIPDDRRELQREADMKFVGQIFEVTTRLPVSTFGEADKEALRDRFIADYEEEFGTGTAWTEADILLINTRVRAIGRSDVQTVKQIAGADEERHGLTRRAVLEPLTGERVEIDVHRGFGALGRSDGPCLLEEPDTTVYVPSGATVELTEGGDFLLGLADR